jgi:hypothetical protein
VNEHVSTSVFWRNEAKAFVPIEKLDGTSGHDYSSMLSHFLAETYRLKASMATFSFAAAVDWYCLPNRVLMNLVRL